MKLSGFCKFVAALMPILLLTAYFCGEVVFMITYSICIVVGICTVLVALGNILEILQKIQEKKQNNDHSGDTTEMVKEGVEQ